MYIEDLRNGEESYPFSEFSYGTVLYKKIDPANIFIKIDGGDKGNAVYLENGELFFLGDNIPCCKVKYRFILEN